MSVQKLAFLEANKMKRMHCLVIVLAISFSAVAQTGGGFNLEQNVIGDGGWRSDGGGFTILGTMGQSNAGSTTAGGYFHLIDGLWATENQTSNSPFATVSGRVVRRNGVGIPGVLVTITNPHANLSFQTRTEAHGSYTFAKIPIGANYVITAQNKYFDFRPASQALFISQDRNNVNFVSKKTDGCSDNIQGAEDPCNEH
jgi:hypothetical protein